MLNMLSKTTHIAFCVNDTYAPYIAVTIKSIVKNTLGKCMLHILTDYISTKNRRLLNEVIAGCDRLSLQIYEVNDTSLAGLKSGRWTKYTWYRLLIPETLSDDIDRILYLDADTLVVAPLEELFSTDLMNYAIAGVPDGASFDAVTYDRLGYDTRTQYICAGVLLMNLKCWRIHQLSQKIIEWASVNSDRLVYADQDAINYICRHSTLLLPLRYNVVYYYFERDFFYRSYIRELKECVYNPVIIHYGDCAPWLKDMRKHPMHKEWIKYNRMLLHPVKRIYKSRGWLLMKMIIWNMLHPQKNRMTIELDEVKRRLNNFIPIK